MTVLFRTLILLLVLVIYPTPGGVSATHDLTG